MSHLDQLNNDLVVIIAQHQPIRELLYFIRSHRRLHTLNQLESSSWSSRAFEYSHVSIELNKDSLFPHWLINCDSPSDSMPPTDFVYSVEPEISQSKNKILLDESQNFNFFRFFLLNPFRSCRRSRSSEKKLTQREIARQLYSKRRNKGLISLSLWHAIKDGFCYTLNGWLNEYEIEREVNRHYFGQ